MTSLSVGSRLGPYHILESAGAGGMGEVYKAHDSRLDRVVAIKVLPRQWAENAEMRQRFEREAQTLASLNHPHICVLYDIGQERLRAPKGSSPREADREPSGPGAVPGAAVEGTPIQFLVMEYLEGETLAARLEQGMLSLDEALRIGIEIVDALDKAHRRGVVHRDLKPSNVMLTKSGTKLLDFGLARWTEGGTTSTSDSPTTLPTGKDLTTPGTILGTLQYMAPEQLEGLQTDGRTDIFAFGVLLHEMITGKKAFEGKSRVLLISAIATAEPPPVSSIQASAPPALDHVIKVCLAKEAPDRWQTARDLLAELEWIAEGGAETPAGVVPAPLKPRRVWLRRLLVTAAALVLGAGATAAARYLAGEAPADELRFRVPIQLGAASTVAGGRGAGAGAPQGYQGVSGPAVFNAGSFAISPDGRLIAFVARQAVSDPWMMFVRPVDAVTAQRLPGTDDASSPFWSADSRSIGFVSAGRLKRVEATGGPPQEICEAAGFAGGTWNKDGFILFGTTTGVQRVRAQGGKPEALTKLAELETGHYWPHFLPDGRHFLYTVWSGQPGNRAIVAASLDAPDQRTHVLASGSNAGYAEPGYLVFQRENALYAHGFDLKSLKLTGDPVRVADEVGVNAVSGLSSFSVARQGALAYYFSSNAAAGQGSPQSDLSDWQLSWVSRTGQVLEAVGAPGVYRGYNASPDTKRVAVHRHDASGGDIVVFEPRGSDTRLTFDAKQHNSMPIWSPSDGSRIVFASLRNGKWGLYQTLSTRSGSEELLFESDLPCAPMSWSPDGERIVFWVQDPTTAGDIWVLALDDKKASPLIATPANEIHPQISPDGKWIAFADNSKDGRNEIYVHPFPSGSGRYQISVNGGGWPRWRGDTKELFFHAVGTVQTPSVQAGAIAFSGPLLSAPISVTGGVLEPGSPKELLVMPIVNLPHTGGQYLPYDVSPDGERVLLAQFVPPATVIAGSTIGPDTTSGLTIALNWANALKK